MTFKRLLAKSPRDPIHLTSGESLTGHTVQVVTAGETLVRARGMASLVALGLQDRNRSGPT